MRNQVVGTVSKNPFKGMRKHSRAYLLALIAYWGALLFGYDTGVAGSTIALNGFIRDFDLTGQADRVAELKSNIVAVLQAGCFFGALAAAPISHRFGRKITLMAFTTIFFVGAAVQTAATNDLIYIYVGRVLAGLGVGAMSAVSPPYVSENAPKELRGRITGMFQLILAAGVMISYWIPYGCAVNLPTSTLQWRIPIGFQLVPAGLMFICLFFAKESPRWLILKGREEEAIANLCWLRKAQRTDADFIDEYTEIVTAVEEDKANLTGSPYRELFRKGQWPRLLIATTMMLLTQFSGQNSIGYYAPTIFQSIGFNSSSASLLASGVYGLIKFLATGVFLLIGIEQFGRRKSLLFGALLMAMFFVIIGSVLYTHPPDPTASQVAPASMAAAAMIYLYVIPYAGSWSSVVWVYVSEIFPTRTRPAGVSIAAATQWLFNFTISKITPYLLVALPQGRIFFMFAGINLLMAFYAFWLPETRGLSLEQMDIVFGAVTAEQRQQDLQNREASQFAKSAIDDKEETEHVETARVKA